MANQKALPRRILVVGKSGSGKSTLAQKLSRSLGIKYLEMDAMAWRPNWVMAPNSEIRAQLEGELDSTAEWVVDGNYRACSDLTWSRAELIIWLDYPIVFVLWRLFLRSVWRIWTRKRVCGENYEGLSAILWPSYEQNVLLACLKQSGRHARDYPKLAKEYGEDKLLVFTNEGACCAWLDAVSGHYQQTDRSGGDIE